MQTNRRQLLALVALAVPTLGATALASSAPVPPPTVTAHRLTSSAHGVLKPGSKVSSRSLGTRTFVDGRHGFALATVQNVTYPAATTDGGASWRTDGPELHLPAAQAPLVVTQSGAARHTYFAYGGPGGGGAVDITGDAGKHWYQAFFGDVVLAVVHDYRGLVAVTQASSGSGNGAVTWVYVSSDGGRHWHYNNTLGAF